MKPEQLTGELLDMYQDCLGQCKFCLCEGDCELEDKLKNKT